MAKETVKLKNVNLLTKELFDDIENPATNELYAVETPSIVETYDDGAGNWYRVWSDGWIEQGGYFDNSSNTSTGQSTINLLKPYDNINYTVQVTYVNPSTSAPSTAWIGCLRSKSTGSFVINRDNLDYTKGFDWIACGQGE